MDHFFSNWRIAIRFGLALVVLAGFVSPPPVHAEEWKIKDFQVVAVEPSGSASGPFQAVEVLAPLARMTTFDIDFPDSKIWQVIDVKEQAIVIEEIEKVLHESAIAFEQAGLPAPELEPVVTAPDGRQFYRVYLVRGIPDASGFYDKSPCDRLFRNERVIVLDLDELAPHNYLTSKGRSTISHELFHAVQYATPLFRQCVDQPVGSWITEGMARGVGLMRMHTVSPSTAQYSHEKEGLQSYIWGRRDYARPLPVPYDREKFPPSSVAYHTSSFWMYLGELDATGGNPRTPGVNPYSLKYLARFLSSAPPQRDCNTAKAACKDEIRWLDKQIRGNFGISLQAAYTRFIQAYALYGRWRAPARPLFDPDWVREGFRGGGGCQEIELTAKGPGTSKRVKVGEFPAISARCWEVVVTGFEEDTATVSVTADMPSGRKAPTLGHLSTAIANGTGEWSNASVESGANGRQEAQWIYDVKTSKGGANGQLIVMTNVASNAEYTPVYSPETDTAVEVTFAVLQEYANITPRETARRRSDLDIGPAPGLELDRINVKDVLTTAPEMNRKRGWQSACILSVSAFNSENGDTIKVLLHDKQPISTGDTFAVLDLGNNKAAPEDHPSKVLVDYTTGVKMTVGKFGPLKGRAVRNTRDAQTYLGSSGHLRITAFSPNYVSGVLSFIGKQRRDKRYNAPPMVGPESKNVTFEFGFSPRINAGLKSVSLEGCFPKQSL